MNLAATADHLLQRSVVETQTFTYYLHFYLSSVIHTCRDVFCYFRRLVGAISIQRGWTEDHTLVRIQHCELYTLNLLSLIYSILFNSWALESDATAKPFHLIQMACLLLVTER